MAIEKFDLVLESSQQITPNVLHMAFKRADGQPLNFIPGQFITFMLDSADGVKRRSYSIASIPGKTQTIDIAIAHVEGGIASAKLFDMKPGDRFAAMGPAGRLVLQDEPVKRYILVGTGTGIAPYRAMVPALAQRFESDKNVQVELLLGVQYRKDMLYGQDFIEFAEQHNRFHFNVHLSREDISNERQSYEYPGYVQTQFESLNLNPEYDVVYLCGNPNMIDDAFKWLVDRGFATKNIRREKYISSN